jgi:hypothetical protein
MMASLAFIGFFAAVRTVPQSGMGPHFEERTHPALRDGSDNTNTGLRYFGFVGAF